MINSIVTAWSFCVTLRVVSKSRQVYQNTESSLLSAPDSTSKGNVASSSINKNPSLYKLCAIETLSSTSPLGCSISLTTTPLGYAASSASIVGPSSNSNYRVPVTNSIDAHVSPKEHIHSKTDRSQCDGETITFGTGIHKCSWYRCCNRFASINRHIWSLVTSNGRMLAPFTSLSIKECN